MNNIPIKTSVAVLDQSVKGKIYAPAAAYCEMTLDEILENTKQYGVIEVRKFFNDPAKSKVPLFILTFFGTKLPERIFLGYQSIPVDQYIPTPMICLNCYRMGHSTKMCHARTKCRKCGAIDHSVASCTSNIEKCANCDGPHQANDRRCPRYKQEAEICRVKANKNISFQEARRIVCTQNQSPQTSDANLSLTQSNRVIPPTYSNNPHSSTSRIFSNSAKDFPSLPSLQSYQTQADPDTSGSEADEVKELPWFTQQRHRRKSKKKRATWNPGWNCWQMAR